MGGTVSLVPTLDVVIRSTKFKGLKLDEQTRKALTSVLIDDGFSVLGKDQIDAALDGEGFEHSACKCTEPVNGKGHAEYMRIMIVKNAN